MAKEPQQEIKTIDVRLEKLFDVSKHLKDKLVTSCTPEKLVKTDQKKSNSDCHIIQQIDRNIDFLQDLIDRLQI